MNQDVATQTLTGTRVARIIMQAVHLHPEVMSPFLLELTLRGERISHTPTQHPCRRNIASSPFFGALMNERPWYIGTVISALRSVGYLATTPGFYGALFVTPEGEKEMKKWA